MKITKDMLANITKGNSYSINPKEIKVDADLNPRKDYGSGDDWESFKNSIKDYGVQQNIKVFYDEVKKTFHLAHGFRRMKAITELLIENPDEEKVQSVNIDIVEDNKEQAIIGHFILNSGKPLNDVEMGDALKLLKDQIGDETITNADLAKRTGLPANKVGVLLNFAEKAGVRIKKAVINGEISFSGAKTIVKDANGISNQGKILNIAKEKAAKTSTGKIKGTSLSKKVNLETKIGVVLSQLVDNDEVQPEALNMFRAVLKAINENESIENIIPLFNIQSEHA